MDNDARSERTKDDVKVQDGGKCHQTGQDRHDHAHQRLRRSLSTAQDHATNFGATQNETRRNRNGDQGCDNEEPKDNGGPAWRSRAEQKRHSNDGKKLTNGTVDQHCFTNRLSHQSRFHQDRKQRAQSCGRKRNGKCDRGTVITVTQCGNSQCKCGKETDQPRNRSNATRLCTNLRNIDFSTRDQEQNSHTNLT